MESLPIPVKNAMRKLGSDIRDARLRRRIPVAVMAQRAFISRTTLVKLEKGYPGVAIGTYAAVLFALGMLDRLRELAGASSDEIGLALDEERLPKRIEIRPRHKTTVRSEKAMDRTNLRLRGPRQRAPLDGALVAARPQQNRGSHLPIRRKLASESRTIRFGASSSDGCCPIPHGLREETVWGNRGLGSRPLGASPDDARRGRKREKSG